MRILYLHQYFKSLEGAGGTRSYEFARRLIDAGHEVCMITSPAYLPEKYKSIKKTTEMEIDGIPTVIIPVKYTNNMSFSARMRAFVRFAVLCSREAVTRRADVVFATSTPLTIAIPAILARWFQRIPMVFEVRDLWPELPIAVGAIKNPVAQKLARGLEWFAYHNASHVVALSPGMAEGVKQRGIPPQRVSVIPNSCDNKLFNVPPSRGNAVRKKLGLAPDQPLVVYTGTFGLINNVSFMVDVAAAMKTAAPEVRFLLVGGGAEREKVLARAKAKDVLDKNLFVWGPVSKREMPNILAAATVATSLFMPLEPMWNNSANKFFDALAAGKPIAINYGGWQADLINEHSAGIVMPGEDPTQAAKMLSDFIHDQDRLHKAASASRKLARTHFDRDRLAQQMEQVLRTVAEDKSRVVTAYPGKRLLDIGVSSAALLMFAPVMAMVAGMIRLEMGSPILFKQERPGLGGKTFSIFKFRTMTNKRDDKGKLLPSEQRVTTFGKILRRTSLDELPELLNVLRGDMSLVGPRPLLTQYLELYTPEQMRRHNTKPGITGWAQINGRNGISWEEKFKHDLWYVENMSLWLDLKILALTAWKVIRRENINQDGREGAERFRGTLSQAAD